jgi:hypothetical protein
LRLEGQREVVIELILELGVIGEMLPLDGDIAGKFGRRGARDRKQQE